MDDNRLRTPSTKSPKARGSSLKHKTRSPADTVRQSEQSLRQLLEDFEEGRLNAFGNSDMLQKMNNIREIQEKLTLKHFEIDQIKMNQEDTGTAGRGGSTASASGDDKNDDSLMELTQALEKLGNEIQSLHSTDSLKRPESRTGKRVSVRTEQELVV